MKILVIVGSHARNLGLLRKLYNNKNVEIAGVILFKREDLIPKPNESLSEDIKKLWYLHFEKRKNVESKHFSFQNNIVEKITNKLEVSSAEELHSDNVLNFIGKINIDSCFIAGVPIIKKNY